MISRSRFFPLVFGLLLVVALGVPVWAQFNASIQGTVLDPTGAAIPGVMVKATNQETGKTYESVSSDTGFYRIAKLPPGKYTVTVEHTGFKKYVVKDLEVGAESMRGNDIKLDVGAVTESVTVVASAEGIQTESANITGGIGTEMIQRLPQVGRDPYELLRLAPGVFGDGARNGSGNAVLLPNTPGPGASNSSIFQTENQPQISANGQRLSGNNYSIDGVSVNSLGWGGAAVVTPNQESVKEVRVLSSSYSAEDGRNPGAQVKVISQNGTNEFHGSAFYKHGDPGLNSYNKWGGPGGALPTRDNTRLRQFGGSLGGPVVKEKLFFFFSYEGMRVNTNQVSTPTWVETPEFRNLVVAQRSTSTTAKVFGKPGIAPRIAQVLTPVAADCSGFGGVSPTTCQIVGNGLDIGGLYGALGQYNPLGNATGGGLDNVPDIQHVTLFLPGHTYGHQYNGRVDYSRGKDQFAYSFYITKLETLSADGAGRSRPMGDVSFFPLNRAMTATWVRTLTSTLLNEARYNFTRFAADQVKDSGGVDWGIPRIEVESLPFDRIRFGPPQAETTPGIFAQNTFELRDMLSKVLGAHGLKGGIEVRWEQDNNNLAGGARPVYSFHRLWNLANDTPIYEGINTNPNPPGGPGDAQRYFRTHYLGFFVHDDWKLRPNLTFNIGLRYEYFSPLREHRGHISNLVFTPPNLLGSKVEVMDQLYAPDRNNFAPRLGFAWSPEYFANKLVIRGGFGVAFNRIPEVVLGNSRANPPWFARNGICCGTTGIGGESWGSPFVGGKIIYTLGASNSPTSYPSSPLLAVGIDPNTGGPTGTSVEIYGSPAKNPNGYVYLFSLETEYQLPWHLTTAVGYQGSSSHKLIRLVNQNFLYPPNGSAWYAVYFPTPDVNANFHSLNLRVRRAFVQGFEIEGKYRWSKSIDTLSNEGPGAMTNQTDPANLASERGASDYDATHYLTISALWDLPILRNRKDTLGRLLGGWQINTLLSAHSGFPWTPVTGYQASVPVTGAWTISPTRPRQYFGGAGDSSKTSTFMSNNGNFPGIQSGGCPNAGKPYFDICASGAPGIGRNSFRGSRYFGLDFSFVKSTSIPAFWIFGENTKLNFRANFFNAFNKLNLAPFGFNSPSTKIEDPNFGMAPNGLSGRVIEFQLRFSF